MIIYVRTFVRRVGQSLTLIRSIQNVSEILAASFTDTVFVLNAVIHLKFVAKKKNFFLLSHVCRLSVCLFVSVSV